MITWVSMPSLYKIVLCNIYTDSEHYCFFDNIVTQVIVTEYYVIRKKANIPEAIVKIMFFIELIIRLHFAYGCNSGKM